MKIKMISTFEELPKILHPFFNKWTMEAEKIKEESKSWKIYCPVKLAGVYFNLENETYKITPSLLKIDDIIFEKIIKIIEDDIKTTSASKIWHYSFVD